MMGERLHSEMLKDALEPAFLAGLWWFSKGQAHPK